MHYSRLAFQRLRLTELLLTHGFENRVTTATHRRGGWLDVVATRQSDTSVVTNVETYDVGFSDHHLVVWGMPFKPPPPTYKTVVKRNWKAISPDVISESLSASALCRPSSERTELSVDDLADLYDRETRQILDRVAPERTIRVRERVSDAWFDEDCRQLKAELRRMERHFKSSNNQHDQSKAIQIREKRKEYRRLRRLRSSAFWKNKITQEADFPRKMWKTVDHIRGTDNIIAPAPFSATEFHHYFTEKVESVRQNTSSAPLPVFSCNVNVSRLTTFRQLSVEQVITAVQAVLNKQCRNDPIPTQLLKDHIGVLAPFIVELFNKSLLSGTVPHSFKSAYITPLIKKPDMDVADIKSYRPISNLSVLSKLLERLIAKQLKEHIEENCILPVTQSAYRVNHSTETAVLKVNSDLLMAADSGDLSVLVLLDLSAAFDTVDHDILLKRLSISCGLDGMVHEWFRSYLLGRTHQVYHNGISSSTAVSTWGVPQGSVLGPLLFTLYTTDIAAIVQQHGLSCHLYADDTQIYGRCDPAMTKMLEASLIACLEDVSVWMRSNRLQLNASKTEVMWVGSKRKQHLLPDCPLRVVDSDVKPVSVVRDLGIYLNNDLSMDAHISKTVSSCFGALRTIRTIKDSLPRSTIRTLVSTLVLSRLDYGNAALFGLPDVQLNRYQAVLNAAARLIFNARGRDHVTPLLEELHWLRVNERISFKIACLTWRCLHDRGPSYLSEDIRVVSRSGRRQGLRSSDSVNLIRPHTHNVSHGDRSWSAAASVVWKDLKPHSLKDEDSYMTFRRGLKSYLWTRSYPTN